MLIRMMLENRAGACKDLLLGCLARRSYSSKHTGDNKFYYGDDPVKSKIGNREIVGHGYNGQPSYLDEEGFPFPAIRYRECTPELMALREKERGDWRKLTCEEKKYLYRASFRQTFAELQAPSSEWKYTIGLVLMGLSASILLYLWINRYVQRNQWPASFSREARIAQYYRQVEINNQPFSGNKRPPGAKLRIHPKNKEMLAEIQKAEAEADL